jgi:hypothetical protein
MRTTVRLDGALLHRAREAAARRNITLTALLEEGLQLALAQRGSLARQPVLLPVCDKNGGTLPGLDLNDTAALMDVMEWRG